MMMREWVFIALLDVVQKGTYSNLYLKDHLQEVDEKDRSLAVRIFYGTLQNYRLCESVWKPFARGKVRVKASVLLTMSVYQLLFLSKVPSYAVLNDAVKIAAHIIPAEKGMINAILRKCVDAKPAFPADPAQALALKTSLPDWLIRLWVKQYGPQQAFTFAQASTAALPVWVRINPLKLSREEAEKIDRLIPDANGMYLYTGTQIGTDPLYKQGKISVQDPGSYEIAKWMNVQPGETVLDVCAAPGTKTMAMAELAKDEAEITAGDLHEHRVQLIENDARRLGLHHITAKVQDASELAPNPVYDAVLCDVPCSGFGVLSRKPDMKLHLSPKTIDELLPLQRKILESAAGQVKPGGRLVYSTCTLNQRENEKQVEAFLKEHPEFELDEQETIVPSSRQGGFYIARLLKKDE